jgi:hypothetical protein
MFRYFADIGFDSQVAHSSNASVTVLERNDSNLRCVIDPYQGSRWLPEIPARGGGSAMLGDPTDLVGGPGSRLVPAAASAVPEPGTILLLGAGLAGLGALGRSRRRRVSGRG